MIKFYNFPLSGNGRRVHFALEEIGFQHEPLPSYLAKIVSAFVNHPPQTPPEGYLFRKAELALVESLL